MTLRNISFIVAIVFLTSCSAPTFGLKPIYPKNLCNQPTPDCEILVTIVDSLQPVLRWEAFPPEGIISDAKQISRISNITYDLNIWISENDYPSSLIYSRRGLPEPRHEIEEPLLPCTEYFWTVRARFLIDGKERVSEWGISARPWFWREPNKIRGRGSIFNNNKITG
jgi:hypothetical protein